MTPRLGLELGEAARTERQRPRTNRVWLWVRWGDGSDYESFDAIHEADLDYYFPKGSRVSGFVPYGFTVAPDFVGFNYVSCFWGDAQAQPIRGLDDAEKQILTTLVGKR